MKLLYSLLADEAKNKHNLVVSTSKDPLIQIDVLNDNKEMPDMHPKQFSETLNAQYAQNEYDFLFIDLIKIK